MGLLKRLFGGGEPRDRDALWLYVRCDRCGHKMKIRVDRHYPVNPRPVARAP
jgi:DNA-directed RNA polymerase subunit RPC12/RpoP